MTTKINATDVNVMTFNADPFLASDARMRLCKALKQARTSKEMSQVALSEKSGVARSNIARIESGNLNASLNTILSLCEALDCSLVLITR